LCAVSVACSDRWLLAKACSFLERLCCTQYVLRCSAGHTARTALLARCTTRKLHNIVVWGQAIGLVMGTHRFHSAASRAWVASYAARSSNVPTCSWLDTNRQLDSAAGSRSSSSSTARSTCCVAGGLLLNSFRAWIAAPRTLVIVCEQKVQLHVSESSGR
jgi:hypothetical protein